MRRYYLLIFLIFQISNGLLCFGQFKPKEVYWSSLPHKMYVIKEGNITLTDITDGTDKVIVSAKELTPMGEEKALQFDIYTFSNDLTKLLIFTHTAKVWRYHTRGDYWIYDLKQKHLFKLGKGLPSQSLMYAKLSPDAAKVAFVSRHNIYVEDLYTHSIRQLTKDGTSKMINGTFDWVYEEEFGCRDGFRWSPDGKYIAFWQVDATRIRDYYMLNTTDSVYSHVVPVEYPKVGETPSAVRIGTINVSSGNKHWMEIPGAPNEHYLPRMEWAANSSQLVVQQLNRKQNESKLFYCDALSGTVKNFYTESDHGWIDIKSAWNDDDPTGWDWLNTGKQFLWVSEKDGWRHIYLISKDGTKETLVTKGNFDINDIKAIDEKNGYVYYRASPENATELYLYRSALNGQGDPEMLSPKHLKGTHDYNISPDAQYAIHLFSNYNTYPVSEVVSLPANKSLNRNGSMLNNHIDEKRKVQYFTITTSDHVTVDGWMVRPANFDSTKKYPVVFYVYGEPAASTTQNIYGNHNNFLYNGNMSDDGYFYVALDNRGTPELKGARWRKDIYKNIGQLNIHDQAMAAKEFLKHSWFDTSRVAVWGWSGGGSSTLNLMFQYPEIYKTGISISAVTDLLYYDNIYEERYMGLPKEDKAPYIKGSPITYAKGLKGNLLFIHGSGDDNVHFDNAEALLNELIKYNKQFQFMEYPNRTHSISEGPGTNLHLKTLYTDYLRKYCPPGAR